jgi:hypothetical protein
MALVACTPAAFFNNTASLGGNSPGDRSDIAVAFINNTPFRAIFTFGTYDPLNPDFEPQFRQFFVDPDADNRLEGNSESDVFTFDCGRAMSIGHEQMIARIHDAGLNNEEGVDATALQPGIAFSDRPLDDPDAASATAGRDGGVLTLQGAEYQCDSLLVYTFEVDATQPDGFRIDLTVTLP